MINKIIEEDLQYITAADLNWSEFNGKTVLISGAAGFLPSYMVETLLYLNKKFKTNVKIIGLVRSLEAAKGRFLTHKDNSQLQLIQCDVCKKIKIDEPVDYIIHAASQATPKVFQEDPVGTLLPNVVGTANLLNLAKEKKIKGFIFFSTSGVHGHVDDACIPIKENCSGYLDFTDLRSCYIESKRMGENMCVAWMHQHGIPVKILRPSITYGPGVKLDDGRSFADFISNVLKYENITLYSDGKVIRNFCYIADATLGFFTVLLKGNVGQAYHVAADHDISIIDLARLLVNEVFPERELKVVMAQDSSKNFLRMDFPRNSVDVSKLKELGWSLRHSMKDGFRRTIESFEKLN
ncbi:MAG: NAD-dependent epimerase/dehydratase family protein [Pseudomonadota bacterium]